MNDKAESVKPEAPAESEASIEGRAKALPLRLPVAEPGPLLVPARMVNELYYCERLMYLEWIQGEWADNYFTVDGRSVHKRSEKAKPLKEKKPSRKKKEETDEDTAAVEAEKPYQARSVWLSSETLGLTAKIDVVDVDGGTVVPIEYKRGKRPEVIEGAWLPERAQLCAQVLLLREHGYHCEEAAIYYAKDHQRVPIAITPQLIEAVHRAVVRAREIQAEGRIPPPLIDDPKCKGCSLVGICLPDETNLLAHHPELAANDVEPEPEPEIDEPDPWGLTPTEPTPPPVRRLYAARDDKLPVYVQDQGASIALSGERLLIRRNGEAAIEARLSNTSQISLYGNVQVSTQALRELMNRGIPLTLFSSGGWLVGRAGGFDSKNVELKLAQFRAISDPATCLRLAAGFVESKILNSRTLLRRNHERPDPVALSTLKQLSRKALAADNLGSLLGIEGTAARTYFEHFSGMIKPQGDQPGFDLDGRNRRPPRDPVNALLSFAYSLLTKELTLALSHVGLDPMLGFYHQPHFGRPGLALDLMEEFRPLLADSAVITAINNGVVTPDDFVHAAGSVALKTPARRRFILAFERRLDQLVTHPIFDYRLSYRRVLELQARLLTRLLLGEIDAYPSFKTR